MKSYVVCKACGENNKKTASYCTKCGHNLSQESVNTRNSQRIENLSQTLSNTLEVNSNSEKSSLDQHYIEGASRILIIKKIWVALRTTYKIYDPNDQLFMSVNQPFYYRVISFLLVLAVIWATLESIPLGLPLGLLGLILGVIVGIIMYYLLVRPITRIIHGSSMVLFVRNADGSQAGKLKGNSSWSKWQIIRGSGEKLATFRPYQAKKYFGIITTGMSNFDGELETPTGTYKLESKSHQDQLPRTFSLNLLDMDDKCYLSWRPIGMGKCQFEASNHLDPLVACGVAVCLTDQLMLLQSAATGAD